jgi:saccharopine dehydrogenase-like NADP-dependent oxidoreductase
VTVTGQKAGRLTQETFVRKIYGRRVNGKLFSAIQLTTAAGVCAMVDLMATGQIPDRGFVRQEEISLEAFLGNRFGHHYGADEGARSETTRTHSAGRIAA